MAIDAALGRLGIRPGVCTSSTRPANPFEGQVIYETDTNNIRFWSGSAWESNKGGIVSSSAPTGAAAGDIWYDSDDGRAYIYYDDGSSQQWVEFGAPPVQHGKILQVVQGLNTTEVTTTSTPPVATGLDVTITPSSTSSKVLLLVSCQGLRTRAGLSLYRGGVASGTQLESTVIARYLQGTDEDDGMCFNYLDSPNTTSATTYEVGLDAQATGSIAYLNRNSSRVSTIVALEVSA
jgi:hypothetical protein